MNDYYEHCFGDPLSNPCDALCFEIDVGCYPYTEIGVRGPVLRSCRA